MAKRKQKRSFGSSALLFFLVAALLFGYYYFTEKQQESEWNTDGSLIMRVIDVGQGDSILLGCDGEYMLVDCGEKEAKNAVLDALSGIDKLKYIVATHPHSDHMGGMSDIIRAYPPELFMMPEKEHTSKIFQNMLTALEETNTQAQYIYKGDTFKLGSAAVTVVSPTEGLSKSDLNAYSAVLLVRYQGVSILLTGDTLTENEKDFVTAMPDRIDIYKVAHHGGDTSNSETLLKDIRPVYSVISVGTGNSYGHPTESIMKRLEKYSGEIYRTDLSGDIVFTVKEGKISVTTEK